VSGVDHLPQSSTEVKEIKERVEVYLYSLWAIMACYWVNFTFLIIIKATLQDYPFYMLPKFFFFFKER